MTYANTTLSGAIKYKADQRFTNNETSIVSFLMEIERYDGRTKEVKKHQIKVNLWGEAFAKLIDQLVPGKQVIVNGRPQIDQYNDKEGNPKKSFVVEASSINFISEMAQQDNSASHGANISSNEPSFQAADELENEEIPF